MSDRAVETSATRPTRGAAPSNPRRDTREDGRETTSGEALARFIAAFDELPVGALLCTPDGDRPNAELRRIWRAPADATLDRRAIERSIPYAVDGARTGAAKGRAPHPIRDALGGTATTDVRVFIGRLDGSLGVVRVSARPLTATDDPAEASAILTAIDETAAYDADLLRDAFLGIVGHELRSPISTVVAAAELLAGADLEPAVRGEVLSGLSDEAHRLDRLIEQLISLADLDRRGVRIADEPVHLVHLARRIVDRRRRKLARPTLELREPTEAVPPVSGEEGYIEQVLDILLDNALKYGGRASPTVVAIEPRADDVAVRVLDRGPGISLAGPDPIFSLFQRGVIEVDGEDAQPSGHGIGLFVARSVIEAMGGRIWVENRPSGGAEVGFSLPLASD